MLCDKSHFYLSWKILIHAFDKILEKPLKNEIIILQLIKHYLTLVEGVDKHRIQESCMLGFDEIMKFCYINSTPIYS